MISPAPAIVLPVLAAPLRKLSDLDPIKSTGSVTRAVGLVIESKGPAVSVGDLCYLLGREDESRTPLEVIGFREGTVLSMPLGRMPAVRAGDTVVAAGARPDDTVANDTPEETVPDDTVDPNDAVEPNDTAQS